MNQIISTTEQAILAGILLFIFLLFASFNLIYFIGQIRSRFEYGPSLLPLFGGLIGAFGVLLLPVGEWSDRLLWCWLPLVFDTGCIPYLALGIYFSRKKPDLES